jgi:hypothetical protein
MLHDNVREQLRVAILLLAVRLSRQAGSGCQLSKPVQQHEQRLSVTVLLCARTSACMPNHQQVKV